TIGFTEGTSVRKCKTKKTLSFVLYFPHLFVPLTRLKVLTLGKMQINLLFRSLIRTFAPLFRQAPSEHPLGRSPCVMAD
ncbi:MAG: hypothetical protein Q4E32_09660, partial [Bacteroidales bacterium]|nr:hypothetical protein [Bacteroidales bacterium]